MQIIFAYISSNYMTLMLLAGLVVTEVTAKITAIRFRALK